MFYWPHLELTDYEKRFVSWYKTDKLPGVLRRSYKVLFNNVINTLVPGFEQPHTEGSVQIARRTRIFGLSFSGDVHQWRLNIATSAGEQYTPRLPGGFDPRVTALAPGVAWNSGASDMAAPMEVASPIAGFNGLNQTAFAMHPLIVEPNWEMLPNESLLFTGTPLNVEAIILEIAVHVWEFPGMVIGAKEPDPTRAARFGQGERRC